jgi:hypothetical protein
MAHPAARSVLDRFEKKCDSVALNSLIQLKYCPVRIVAERDAGVKRFANCPAPKRRCIQTLANNQFSPIPEPDNGFTEFDDDFCARYIRAPHSTPLNRHVLRSNRLDARAQADPRTTWCKPSLNRAAHDPNTAVFFRSLSRRKPSTQTGRIRRR